VPSNEIFQFYSIEAPNTAPQTITTDENLKAELSVINFNINIVDAIGSIIKKSHLVC
jgi:hypothetical protein